MFNSVLWDFLDLGPYVGFTQQMGEGQDAYYGGWGNMTGWQGGAPYFFENTPWFDPEAESPYSSYGNIMDPEESPYIFYMGQQYEPGELDDMGWQAFDYAQWMQDYGMYLPGFNQQDLLDVRQKAKYEGEDAISNVLDKSNVAGMALSSGVFNTNEDWRKLQDVLLATSRLSRFKGQQEEATLLNQYETDLLESIGTLAEVGAFNIGGDSWTGQDIGTWTGEYFDEDPNTYSYDVNQNFCLAMCMPAAEGYSSYQSSYYPGEPEEYDDPFNEPGVQSCIDECNLMWEWQDPDN